MARDEEIARKTLQEMRDEKLAMEIQEMEQQRLRPLDVPQQGSRIRRDQVDNTDFPGVRRRGVSQTQSGWYVDECITFASSLEV